ncbi:SDR family NAD(P)-dependent oxidoreductase [Paracoccus marinaquae]|uniref:SDR family NAD(P)-dependent oxidoreductase n=1 Tax=Paracoccus marinaquae TaxID=2841926 RepID=A0ABS6AG01_9RHOB|nr:SDR family NAD(P)-dependent oxidoreductase [Paracoccus marinaquae]MBU3028867.1 SDR family NAD(P)-dependent oxidoreductase [Paracoccus marinaquae]
MQAPLSLPSKILLTGGTSGIGAAMTDRLLAAGHHVITLARHATRLSPRPGLEMIDIDLSDSAEVRRVAAEIAARHADLSVLINNAGLQYPAALTEPDFDSAAMEAEVAVNLLAPALLVHGLLDRLRANAPGSAVVNIGSGLACFPKRRTALYCATKAGLHSFSQSLRYQLGAERVAVIEAILPLVDTPMTRGRGRGKITPDEAAAAIIAAIRTGRPEIWIGKARLLPVMSRLVPAIPRRLLRGS